MKKQQGFTLIELMIVVAIIGILSAIAVPAYSNYTVKSKVVASLAEAGSYKTAVALCNQEQGGLTNCDEGSNGVPSAASKITGITDGALTINPDVDCNADGTDDTFIITPAVSGGVLAWSFTTDAGGCEAKI
ncbi:pilin [Photobacterium leiognathi]|uniref:pilin n=1 Tax=Photobacterium leiognathi TaxID=553611 RepID=UPI00298100DB|nr:prepilin-type N-terminal cleavage/methylation domain-containing protein [Photobacterium leiognathi]